MPSKLCKRPSCATRGQAVLHAANANLAVHTRPSFGTQCKGVQHPVQGVQHAAKLLCYTLQMQNSLCTHGQVVQHTAKVCNTLQSCATRGQCKICCAHAAKLCYTLQRCATRGQGVQHTAKLCNTRPKLCNTRPMRNSLRTRSLAALHAAKLCNTRPSCATRCECKIRCAHAANIRKMSGMFHPERACLRCVGK
jgi:hypothetical protein